MVRQGEDDNNTMGVAAFRWALLFCPLTSPSPSRQRVLAAQSNTRTHTGQLQLREAVMAEQFLAEPSGR